MKMNAPPEQEASPQGTSPESGESPRLSTRQATRRRILQAAAGAPVVFTLPTGTALANSSSACVGDRAEDNPSQVTLTSDKWVRFETLKLDIKSTSNGWVSGFKYDQKYFHVLDDGTAQEVTPASKGASGELHVELPEEGGNYYVLVHHDGGQLILSTQDETGAPLTGSCWASVGGAWLLSNS